MITVERLTVRAGSFALEEISFALAEGEYGVLMGRTGSGKTTLLEALCGLKPVVAGEHAGPQPGGDCAAAFA